MIFKKEIIEHINKELLLPYVGYEQDWDIEMADSKRINEFLDFYETNKLSQDLKVALMSLILASYNDFLNENKIQKDKRWEKLKVILELEKSIFSDLIDYWAFSDSKEEDCFFNITPLVRNIK